MFRGAIPIWGRDMTVAGRGLWKELIAVVAHPITFYLAFGFGLRGYISDVEGTPYTVFIAPGLITMTAVQAAFSEGAWSMWFHRRVQKTIEEYRTTPITVYDIVVGKIISGFTLGAMKGM
ncbi:MAG TPA: ABC transporter permease, partial [Verrucomicrobiae bacterium]|nr:ABC transporter permease [Verrucomicrobiae bacterium]